MINWVTIVKSAQKLQLIRNINLKTLKHLKLYPLLSHVHKFYVHIFHNTQRPRRIDKNIYGKSVHWPTFYYLHSERKALNIFMVDSSIILSIPDGRHTLYFHPVSHDTIYVKSHYPAECYLFMINSN